jgi:DNA-directed RNA polymerase specialized sigma24 family protein
MATIKYKMADGRIEKIEVTEEFAAKYEEFEKEEQRRIWRERWHARNELALEELMILRREIADPVNCDPLELLIEKDEIELPLFTGLTKYQRRVAVKCFVERKTHRQIAKEEGVSHQSITRLIQKIQKKAVCTFE